MGTLGETKKHRAIVRGTSAFKRIFFIPTCKMYISVLSAGNFKRIDAIPSRFGRRRWEISTLLFTAAHFLDSALETVTPHERGADETR